MYSGRLGGHVEVEELVGQKVQKDVRQIEGTEDNASLAHIVHFLKPQLTYFKFIYYPEYRSVVPPKRRLFLPKHTI
jgi:hypothetical protein